MKATLLNMTEAEAIVMLRIIHAIIPIAQAAQQTLRAAKYAGELPEASKKVSKNNQLMLATLQTAKEVQTRGFINLKAVTDQKQRDSIP